MSEVPEVDPPGGQGVAGAASGPTSGDPEGRHRVLEPPGGPPVTATRLDPAPAVWDRERRVALEAVVLSGATLARLARAGGGDPLSVRAALLEATAERGALPLGTEAVLVGTLEAAGPEAPRAPAVGARVALAAPADVVPLWLQDASRWSGLDAVVHVRGHAVVGSHVPLVDVGEESPATAARIVPWLGLADLLGTPADAVVLGADHLAGLLAVEVLVAAGAVVHATVADLGAARVVQAAGAVPVLVGLHDPIAAVAEVAATVDGPPSLVVLAPPARVGAEEDEPTGPAAPAGGALAAGALAGPATRVVVLRPGDAPAVAATLDSRGIPAQVVAGRTYPHRPAALSDVASRALEAARWQAGVGPRPRSARPEDA